MFLDFHTHNIVKHENTKSIYNVILNTERLADHSWRDLEAISLGIHPWFIDESSLEQHLEALRFYAQQHNVKCIGEAGIDKLKGGPLKLQEEVFIRQIRIAEGVRKPIVVHCVRAFNEIISIQKVLKPKVPMVVHGFAKNAELAKELIKNGFYLSFGADLLNRAHIQEALMAVPIERIFLETDSSSEFSIFDVYCKAEAILNREIQEQIYQNYLELFI